MERKPVAGEHGAEQSDLLPEPNAAEDASPGGPGLVLRPKVQWLAAGPGLIILALVVLAVGRLRAAPLALVLVAAGVAFLPAWRDRVDAGPATIVRHSWRVHQVVRLDEIDALRLRRVALPFLRWLPRGYRFGRFWSLPLTLRLMQGEETPLLELRCAWWNGWPELTRFVVTTMPDLDLDGRTRGRLERYVGLVLPASSQR